MSGLISKAKEELAKSKIKGDVKTNVENDLKKPEPKKSEIELHWEELMKNMDRELVLCDLNFTDLTEEDEGNVLQPRGLAGSSIPPPPPPSGIMQNGVGPIPPPSNLTPPSIRSNGCLNENLQNKSPENDINCLTTKKTKKTVMTFLLITFAQKKNPQIDSFSTNMAGEIILEGSTRGYDCSHCWSYDLGRIAASRCRHIQIGAFV